MAIRISLTLMLAALVACGSLRADDFHPSRAGMLLLAIPDFVPTEFNRDAVKAAEELRKAKDHLADRPDLAFQLLHDSLTHDTNQTELRRVLELPEDRFDRKHFKTTAAVRDHARYGWKRGRHWRCESAHFAVETNVSAEQARTLAQELELLREVWRQVYFDYWAEPGWLKRRLAGEEVAGPKEIRHEVVLFRDREEYLRQLRTGPAGASVSSGIYLDEERLAVFFAGEGAKKSTWYHEATHQLFSETGAVPAGVGTKGDAWLIEAAALVMETLHIENRYDKKSDSSITREYAELGGWDAENLQFARLRVRSGDFHMHLAQLGSIPRGELQQHPEIRRIYSQTAGLGQFFLLGAQRKYAPAFSEALKATYAGRSGTQTLLQATGETSEALDRKFVDFLNVTDDDFRNWKPRSELTKLSLRRCDASRLSLKALGTADFSRLEWLDLAQTKCDDSIFRLIGGTKSLKQLFLDRSAIGIETPSELERFPNLEELYLSGLEIDDPAIASLSQLKRLRVLDLSHTRVTDRGLALMPSLPLLETIYTDGTSVTPAGLAALKKKSPKLRIEK